MKKIIENEKLQAICDELKLASQEVDANWYKLHECVLAREYRPDGTFVGNYLLDPDERFKQLMKLYPSYPNWLYDKIMSF